MTTINGLPAHGLLVHVIVVFIPLAAVLLVVVAGSPPARRRLSAFTAIVAAVALVSVPLTTQAGRYGCMDDVWRRRRFRWAPVLR